MSAVGDRARNLNNGFALINQALELLKRIDGSLMELVRRDTDRAENALGEGALALGPVTVNTNGIALSGWNSPNIVEANDRRRGLLLQNTSPAGGPTITLGLGTRQPTAGSSVVLPPGATWDGLISGLLWQGSVTPVASANGATMAGVEA